MKKILFTILIFASLITFGQKALVINGEIIRTGIPQKFERANGQTVWGGYNNLHDTVHYNDGWRDVVIPTYDAATQRLGARYYNAVADIVTYPVINKTPEELAAEQEQQLQMLEEQFDPTSVKRLLQNVVAPILVKTDLTEQEIKDVATLYPYYRVGKAYEIGNRFQLDSKLFEVIQAHTSQADWLPEKTPALYKKYVPAGTVAEFVQPTGAHDAYMKGDQVMFNGVLYESIIDNNSWSPSAYPQGWKPK